LRDYLPESMNLTEEQILPLTMCLVQYGATCGYSAYRDAERIMAEKVDETISFRRDPNNGAGLWAVFVNQHPIHHFRADQNFTQYMEKLAANLKAKLKIYDDEESGPAAVGEERK
jgi:hypothetical protein